MKLQQLFEYQFPEIRTRKVKRAPDQYNLRAEFDHRKKTDPESTIHTKVPSEPRVMRDPDVAHLGTGSYSSVYAHKDKPHDVRKLSRATAPTRYDGFWTYIKALSKHYDNGNPYFPRFGSITNYEDPVDQGSYSVEMERLNHIDILSKRELAALTEKLFGEKNMKYLFSLPSMRSGGSKLVNIIANMFRSEELRELIEDKDLLNAIKFILKLEAVGGFLDIHNDNIMIRNTPYGKQLVFSDPLG